MLQQFYVLTSDDSLQCESQWHENTNLVKSKLTYLPLKIKTIVNQMICLQKSAKEVNMVYASITFDMGAAINAYKILWNQYEGFQNV